MDILISDLFVTYRGDSEYGFCSFDVVSMFDNLSMELVKGVISQLDMRVDEDVMVSSTRLLALVDADADIFDAFRYTSPSVPSSPAQFIHQRKGIFMGGNTSTCYADLYMSHCVARMRKELKSLGVLLVRKYVDDFLLYMPKRNFLAALELFQSVTKLAFTIEEPIDGRLPYLDVMLVDKDGQLATTWYVIFLDFLLLCFLSLILYLFLVL